jgi:DNA-binding transcriptional ArsR family regulator
MLRIHFTDEDLTRVRVAAAPDPLWEVLLSLHLLGKPDGEVVFGQWRRRTIARLLPAMRVLFQLAPPSGYSPDFLTPTASSSGVEPGIDAILTTPRQRLRRELALLASGQLSIAWRRPLAEGDPVTLRRLGEALHLYHRRVLAPDWNHIRARFDVDRAGRARAFADGGTDRVLGGLHPAIRWEQPVLYIGARRDGDIWLHGQGLRLLPSFFCWRDPITLYDPDLPPVLVYPIEHELGWAGPPAGPHAESAASHRLAALLGRTRAAALQTIDSGCTTTGLARRLSISPASASEHATVLREAGLVVTQREGNAVHHTLTPLGSELLNKGHVLRTQ